MTTTNRCPRCGSDLQIGGDLCAVCLLGGVAEQTLSGHENTQILQARGGDEFCPDHIGRYQVVERIGQGGMGTVFRVFDLQFERSLAVKVIHPRSKDQPEAIERFLFEARISGQLQHPGIPPIHEMGGLEDELPFFAMKLIEGQTLASLLNERTSPKEDLARFIHIFGQVCQTIAFAHSRSVIHRDLKPANIMVGAFGEVQVMDWGLAKLIAMNDNPMSSTRALSDRFSLTQTGTTMGTPSYMAPEQSRGETKNVDRRSDVFQLGAMLCEILTGSPPFQGATVKDVLQQSARGDLSDALTRLRASEADQQLIALAEQCLRPTQEARPADASIVAEAVERYHTQTQQRLREAEVERAAAESRVNEERKRRRVVLALASMILLLILLVGGALFWRQQRRATLVSDASLLLHQAEKHLEARRWSEAEKALSQARGRLGEERIPELVSRLQSVKQDVDLVSDLKRLRLKRAIGTEGDSFDYAGVDEQYTIAFRRYGIDISNLELANSVQRARNSAIREELLTALDDWIIVRSSMRGKSARRLRELADAVTESQWRRNLRAAIQAHDVEKLRALARDEDALAQPAAILSWLGMRLHHLRHSEEAITLLKQAQDKHPLDFWINYELGVALNWGARPPRYTEAVGFCRVAVAVRPDSAAAQGVLGVALLGTGDRDGAIECWRKSAALNPKDPQNYINIGYALLRKGEKEAAIKELFQALKVNPKHAAARRMLTSLLKPLGRLEELKAFDEK